MQAPSQLFSTDSTIKVQWLPLFGAETGNSVILTYNLYWDRGSSEWEELTDSLRTDWQVTGLTGGVSYKFKVRANNIYGYGIFSEEYTVEAADVPGRPELPVVSLSN
jgi:hypothetical protein